MTQLLQTRTKSFEDVVGPNAADNRILAEVPLAAGGFAGQQVSAAPLAVFDFA